MHFLRRRCHLALDSLGRASSILESVLLWYLLTREQRTLRRWVDPTVPRGYSETPVQGPLGLPSKVSWLAADQAGAFRL